MPISVRYILVYSCTAGELASVFVNSSMFVLSVLLRMILIRLVMLPFTSTLRQYSGIRLRVHITSGSPV